MQLAIRPKIMARQLPLNDSCRIVRPYHALQHATDGTDPNDPARMGQKSTTISTPGGDWRALFSDPRLELSLQYCMKLKVHPDNPSHRFAFIMDRHKDIVFLLGRAYPAI